MIRLAWRQFRTEAIAGMGALVAVAVVLAVTGPHLVDVYRVSPNQVTTTDQDLQTALMAALLVVPALVGIFFGAPLVARELESGTFRLIFTQGVTRARWLTVKFALVGLGSSVLAGGLSLMVAWWANPINIQNANRFSPSLFGMFGIVPFGYALFAFALGATTGLLFRRTLPAMATTLVAYAAARLAVTFWVRPHFGSPLMKSFALNANSQLGFQGSQVVLQPPTIPNAWVRSTVVVDQAGHAPTSVFLGKACPGITGGAQKMHANSLAGKGAFQGQMQHCVIAITAKFHGVVTYQPASHYWPFQIYEAALFVVLALALTGVSFWWVRRQLT
jgi:hypothetical protein